MAEAPITTWQRFRQYYATINSGNSSRQAGLAWQRYKLHITRLKHEIDCNTLPTRDEIMTYINICIDIHKPTYVSLIPPGTVSQPTVTILDMWLTDKRSITMTLHALISIPNNQSRIKSNDVRNLELDGHIDPYTMLGTLRLRYKCIDTYIQQHKSDEYGFDLVEEYIITVLTPWLSTILTEPRSLFVRNPSISNLSLIVQSSDQLLIHLTRLYLVTNMWLQYGEQLSVGINDIRHIIQTNREPNEATWKVLRYIKEAYDNLFFARKQVEII